MNREDFPIISKDIIYFDNGATTYKPKCVLDALQKYYCDYTANAHRGDYKNSLIVSTKYEEVRDKVKELINASASDEIVFTKGTTESLNMIVFGYFKNILKQGDEVLLTISEHASNLLPWYILAKEIGIVIKYIPLINNEINIESIEDIITDKTKVISIAHITNVVGDMRDIEKISKIIHKHNMLLVVDAAQSIAHTNVDVIKMDIDFMAFSGHKMYGPSGVGVLYGKYELLEQMKPLNYGGGMNAIFNKDGYIELREVPTRLEAGTPNIEGVIGLGKAIDYIRKIGIDKIHQYELKLCSYLKEELRKLDFIQLYNDGIEGTIVAFNIKGVFAQDTAIYLDKYNICLRAGNHCAKILNNSIKVNNTCRISLSFYNTYEEVDYLIKVLNNSKNIWKEIL